MKILICIFLSLAAFCCRAQSTLDTVQGVAILLVELKTTSPTGGTQVANLSIHPVYVFCIQDKKPVKVTASSAPVTAQGTTTTNRFFATDWTPIPSEDVLVFKKRKWK